MSTEVRALDLMMIMIMHTMTTMRRKIAGLNKKTKTQMGLGHNQGAGGIRLTISCPPTNETKKRCALLLDIAQISIVHQD